MPSAFDKDFACRECAKSYDGAHFLCLVNEMNLGVFQGPRSMRHVDLSHPGKTGSDSVTSANSRICGYWIRPSTRIRIRRNISNLEIVFENLQIRRGKPHRKKMRIQKFPDSCGRGVIPLCATTTRWDDRKTLKMV